MSAPDVTVVVVAFNDGARLPSAVRSALGQTLANLEVVIVDDASTDDTAAVAHGLATGDARIRVISLTENSGSCSRPRNTGVDHARAPYVVFLDSDDELERHACKNLLVAAEMADADLATGLCVQRVEDGEEPTETPWLPALYAQRRVLDSIRDLPDLLTDTLSTNKLYRSEFLRDNHIRFPEGISHENLAFTAEAYCTAERIAVVPEQVYCRNLQLGPGTEPIRNRRGHIDDFRQRIQVHRMVDDYLTAHELTDLQALKDVNFLRVDLKLYLGELWAREQDYQQAWLEVAADYLARMDATTPQRAGERAQLAAFALGRRDLPLTLAAANLWVRGQVSTDPVLRDGRVYLVDRHLDTVEGRAALDVTDLRLDTTAFTRLPLYSPVTSLVVDGGLITVEGELYNQLGRIPPDGPDALGLALRHRQGGPTVRAAVSVTAVESGRIRWSAAVDAGRLPASEPGEVIDAFLRVTVGDTVNPTRLQPTALAQLEQAATGPFTPLVDDDGELAFRDNRPAPPTSWRGSRPVRRLVRLVRGRRAKKLAFRLLFMRLPMRRDTVVFESHLGRQYGDNPKYVHQALERSGRPHRAVWSYVGTPSGWPRDSVLVRRDSWRYYYELARAGYWVDNQGFPPVVRKRAGQRYLQTWHGTPLKRMGFDEVRFGGSPTLARQLAGQVSRWDDFVVASSTAEAAFRQAFRLQANVLRTGYPRNDLLFRGDDKELVHGLKERLEIPTDRRIVLYAPTFRDYERALGATSRLGLDLDTFGALAGDEWFLLVRAHYLDRYALPRRHHPYAMDVSAHHDVSELLVLADALLTDYSSVMFDFALTNRPMAFHLYDYELYATSRGTYFDLKAEAPGPVVETTTEVGAWLKDVDATHERYAEAYRRFQQRHCDYEHGTAAEDVVEAVFSKLG